MKLKSRIIRFIGIWSTLLVGLQAHAIELTFNFNVNSSGNTIYACNAGLRHVDPANQICYIDGTTTPCAQGSHNCKCSNSWGTVRLDVFDAVAGDWQAGPGSLLPVARHVESGVTQYTTLFDDSTAWSKRIDNLTFNLGSERYGAEYFLDICFRGSQIEYFEKGESATTTLYAATSMSDVAGTGGASSYVTLSNVAYRAEATCDLQGQGTYIYARNNSNAYNTTDNEATFTSSDWMRNSGAAVAPSSSLTSMINVWINGPGGAEWTHAPRFCKVRYFYNERSVNNFRRWQIQKANVSTYTKIEEGQVSN